MQPKIVFLLSAPYSGSTLLSILLNQHPKISADGEIFPYVRGDDEKCSCGKKQKVCAYYSTVAAMMKVPGEEYYDRNYFFYVPRYCKINLISRAFEGFWLNHYFYSIRNFICNAYPAFKNKNNKFIEKHIEFIKSSLKKRRSSVYFDGTRSFRRAELFTENSLTFKMIYLIRDGRAFCSSYIKNEGYSETKKNLLIAGTVWKKNIKKVDTLRSRFPQIKTLVIRYQDICRSPEVELKKIYGFLDLEYQHSYLHYSADDMHILGNRMRFVYNGVIREDLAWRNRLSIDSINLITRFLEKDLRRYRFID